MSANINIGINAENRQEVVNQLAKILADEYVLYTKTHKAHWNVEGADFYAIHKFFETQFEQLHELVDKVAERIRSLGHYAPATLKVFLELTHLTEMSNNKNDSQGFITELVADHETIIMKLKENINPFAEKYADASTADFITGIVEEHEKMAWFLRAHLHTKR